MFVRFRKFVQGKEGTVSVLTAFCLVMFLGFAGLAIDVGHYMVVKNELQNAADAGALAGVRALFPADLKTATYPVSPDCATAQTVGVQAANTNQTDQTTTVVSDIQTGRWDMANSQFVAGCFSDPVTYSNAVRVTTCRQDTPLFLMQVLGAAPKTLQASSVAVITPVGGLKKGGGFPIAIGKEYVKLGEVIRIWLNDDTALVGNEYGDTGCWFLPGSTPPPDFAGTINSIIADAKNLMPALHCNESIYMNNGVIAGAVNFIADHYLGRPVWLPVVDTIKFNQTIKIDSFCKFWIHNVGQENGKKYIEGKPDKLAQCPVDVADDSTEENGFALSPARLVL